MIEDTDQENNFAVETYRLIVSAGFKQAISNQPQPKKKYRAALGGPQSLYRVIPVIIKDTLTTNKQMAGQKARVSVSILVCRQYNCPRHALALKSALRCPQSTKLDQ